MKKGFLYILLTAIVFTTLEPVSKLIANQVEPVAMTFIRFFIGGAILLPFSVLQIKKKNIKLNAKDIWVMTLLGVLCICISMVLLQYAVAIAESPAIIAIIFSANSVFTIIFAALILKDKITPKKVLAVLLCLLGVIVCADVKSGTNVWSVVLAVLSAVSFSLYTILSKKYLTKVTGIIQTGISFFGGSLVLLIALLVMGTNIVPMITAQTIPYLLYLGIAVTGIGYWSYFRALDTTSATEASMVFFIKPILTPFVALIITGTPLTVRTFVALALVVAGSLLVAMKKKA